MNSETSKCIDVYRKSRLLSVLVKKDRELELKNKSNIKINNLDKTGTIILLFTSLYIVMSSILTS